MIDERDMTLITDYDGRKIDGWYATEKYEGCRGYWDGYSMWTRNGNVVKLPDEFRMQLPSSIALDGEIWAGRGNYELARIATQYGGKHFNDGIRFMVFDAPEYENGWIDRLRYAQGISVGPQIGFATPEVITDKAHAEYMVSCIKGSGGEGIVVRSKSLRLYERGRSFHAMRIK